uniref:Shadow of prion protein 2 n=1 Tax=Cyprinodon variegatus TaxID=28743 RepID=A0A3Q2DTR8_CYPVA
MAALQRLRLFWVLMLLAAALCPGSLSKRGGGFKGHGKGDGSKASSSQSLPKKGLKWAGAAGAGMLGGTGTGYGLGFIGRPKHATGNHHNHKTEHQQVHRSGKLERGGDSDLNTLNSGQSFSIARLSVLTLDMFLHIYLHW